MHVVGYALTGDEGHGSILSYLKDEGWASELTAGAGGDNFSHSSTLDFCENTWKIHRKYNCMLSNMSVVVNRNITELHGIFQDRSRHAAIDFFAERRMKMWQHVTILKYLEIIEIGHS